MTTRFGILWLVAASTAFAADLNDGKAWLHPAPPTCRSSSLKELPASDFFEVAASKEYVAEVRDLERRRFVPLTQETAHYFTGDYYRCPSGKRPFLVRAVFAHGGTGNYTLHRCGNALLVSHASLGTTTIYRRSALVVNLSFTPTDVYTAVSVAE